MEFILNGQARVYEGDPELPLLDYLREQEGIKSPKNGCAPQAACGACTVDLNGKAVLSCVIAMKKVADGVVTTIEGLGEYRQSVYANAFAEKGAAQCGFCTPGIVMRANALINQNPEPDRGEIEQALTPNLCRCTGYKKIVEAIEYAAQAIREETQIPAPEGDGKIGSRQAKYKAQELVLGQHEFVDDIRIEGMLYGALKFSDHPRAIVRAIDTQAAQAVPGVVRVFTAADVPGQRSVGLIRKDWPLMIAVGETTRYVGDVLAGVVAESEQAARQAVEALEIDYEVLAPVTDMHKALEPDSPQVHESGNLLSKTVIRRGDLDAARKASAFTTRDVYETQRIEHAFMEPEASVAYLAEDGVHIYSQGQGIYEDQKQIAKLLDLPLEQVRVTLVPNGGGFGGAADRDIRQRGGGADGCQGGRGSAAGRKDRIFRRHCARALRHKKRRDDPPLRYRGRAFSHAVRPEAHSRRVQHRVGGGAGVRG